MYVLINIFFTIIPLLIAVAYLTLAERKVLAAIQRRKGPNVNGIIGILQPIIDGLKLVLKETIILNVINKQIFILSPIFTFSVSLVNWSILPLSEGIVITDSEFGVLFILAISSLGVYGIILSGWSSNSRYAFLGACRSAAQMISYEIALSLILINILVVVGSFNISQIVMAQEYIYFIIPFWPLFIMFMISALAETNRPPFDLPEAEAELVAGYNVEYSSINFALFFLAEYTNIITMSILITIFFLGGWLPIICIFTCPYIWFFIKLLIILFTFIWIRGTFPRYRYDQLMEIGFKYLLPLSLGFILLNTGILFIFL